MRRLIIPEYIYAVEYDTKTGESRQVFPPCTEEEEQIERRKRIREMNEWYENRPTQPRASEPPKKIAPLTCKRCNATWTPRKNKLPMQCPKCRSPFWNKERVKH